ncbi:MAG: hypothetical protein FH761_16600 [Firmicutes bacterium]|nr:hypothetical protein [Bacillota bacterium]
MNNHEYNLKLKRKHLIPMMNIVKKIKSENTSLKDMLGSLLDVNVTSVTDNEIQEFRKTLDKSDLKKFDGLEESKKKATVAKVKENKKLMAEILDLADILIEKFDVIGNELDKLITEVTGIKQEDLQEMGLFDEYFELIQSIVKENASFFSSVFGKQKKKL